MSDEGPMRGQMSSKPPPSPDFDWHTETEWPGERMLFALILCMFSVVMVVLIALLLGIWLPRLLVAAHGAWVDALSVWGFAP